MRCENCGWEKNTAGSLKCVKCNVPLTGSMISADFVYNHEKLTPSEELYRSKTLIKCNSCGYVLRTGAVKCPNCGNKAREQEKLKTETIVQMKRLVGFLVSYSHSRMGEFFPLYEGGNTLGRDSSNDIVISDQSVSGEHLLISYYSENRKFYFNTVELSQNGTYVNDVFFTRGGGELVDSAVIAVGSTRLFFIAIPEKAFEQ